MPLALESAPSAPLRNDPGAIPPITETELDRVLKLIPTEIIAFYAAAVPIIAEVSWPYFAFVVFLVGTGSVPLVLYLDGQHSGQAAAWPQYLVRVLAFVTWAIAIGWPFAPWAEAEELRWARSLGVVVVPVVASIALRMNPSRG